MSKYKYVIVSDGKSSASVTSKNIQRIQFFSLAVSGPKQVVQEGEKHAPGQHMSVELWRLLALAKLSLSELLMFRCDVTELKPDLSVSHGCSHRMMGGQHDYSSSWKTKIF